MKKLIPVLLVSLLVVFLAPANLQADGMFVVSKFVWDKHKDINEPTQKAILVYDAGREDLILQVKYDGPVDQFGWLIPVPNLPTVQKGSMKCFYELSQFTQQRFESVLQPMSAGFAMESSARDTEPPVKVIETKTVGAYEVVVLSTKDADALAKWLGANQFYFPTNKTDLLDAYVKQQWYFVAVKIDLGKSGGFKLVTESPKGRDIPKPKYSTELKKLASGELNPLQISFASECCVFPLKISSINGRPSEVQVYVLSPEPLLERVMLEKQLPLIYSNDMARAATRGIPFRYTMGTQTMTVAVPPEEKKMIERTKEIFFTDPGELLPYVKVTKTDLPDCTEYIPRLAEKSWWLIKQTWAFKPEEMRDLEFEPAFPVFLEKLGSKYGFFAAASLTPFGSDAVPVIVVAMQSTNPTVRINTAGNFSAAYWGYSSTGYRAIRDPRLAEAAIAWLKDSEPSVRNAGKQLLMDYPDWKPDTGKYVPVFRKLLQDDDFDVRVTALTFVQQLQLKIPREDLLPFFRSSEPEAYSRAFVKLQEQGEKISGDEALPLLQNSARMARLLGLRVLDKNPEKRSVELALPMLHDTDELVRFKAAQTLHTLTGQQFTEDQPDEWVKWWTENKTNLVVQLHPEELRPQFPNSPPPGTLPQNLPR